MFDEAEKIIALIEPDCPKTAAALTEALAGLKTVSCTADEKAKPDAFKIALAAIEAGRIDCLLHTGEFIRLTEILFDAGSVKCSGG